MYEDIFESIRNEAEKRNLRERTIQLYCSNVRYFLRCTGKQLSELTLEDADSFLTQKRLEGRSPETHNHYRSAIKFFYKRVLRIHWDDDDIPAMKREAVPWRGVRHQVPWQIHTPDCHQQLPHQMYDGFYRHIYCQRL